MIALQNVDHLFKEPFGAMAFTYACCNPNGPAIPSGGLWVVEPSLDVGIKVRTRSQKKLQTRSCDCWLPSDAT